MTEALVKSHEASRQSYPLKAARAVLDFSMKEYLVASGYYRSIGAQTSSETYGGSRSLIYYQMLGRATTLRDLIEARKDFLDRHDGKTSDEGGAILRIVGYKLRSVPIAGRWFEGKVRQNDARMSVTNFDYPDGYDRVVGEPEDLRTYLARAQQID